MLFQIAPNIIMKDKLIFLPYSLPPTTLEVTSTFPKGKELSVSKTILCPEATAYAKCYHYPHCVSQDVRTDMKITLKLAG